MSSLLVLLLPLSAMADIQGMRSVIVQNNETEENFVLNSEIVRTEYRTQSVESTCYRQEIIGYETVCSDRYSRDFDVNRLIATNLEVRADRPPREPGRNPERESGKPERPPRQPTPPRDPSPPPRDPRPPREPVPTPPKEPRPPRYPNPPHEPRPPRDPRPIPTPVCRSVPVYRTVAYSCMKTETVSYQVRTPTSSQVNVRLSGAPISKPQTSQCGINFILNGLDLSAFNECSDYIAVANMTQNGVVNYDIKLFDGERFLAPLKGGLKDMSLDNGRLLTAKVGDLSLLNNYVLSLKVTRKKLIGKDNDLIDRTLYASEYSYVAPVGNDSSGHVKIDLEKVFGGIEAGKKHDIKLTLTVKLPEGKMISGGAYQGQDLSQSNEITVR